MIEQPTSVGEGSISTKKVLYNWGIVFSCERLTTCKQYLGTCNMQARLSTIESTTP